MKLEFTHLSKTFPAADPRKQGTPVIDDVTACIETGSLALIGSSGGGKSTLLRLIGGLLTPSAGEIRINGERVPQDEGALTAYRRRLGFVFQQGSLFRHLSARENIMLPLTAVHGWTKEAAAERAQALLSRFGLAEHGDKRPSALSGGQQQRAAIARAVAPNPSHLLLDEPTSALDPEYTAEVLDVVDELRSDGIELVIVTHEMGFARHACETTAFLAEGRLAEVRPSADLFASPRDPALQRFLGRLLEWNV